MKKILLLLLAAISLTACYNTRIMVGNVQPKEPLVEVNKQWNSHFLAGLIPCKNAKMNPAVYVDNAPNYVVRTYTSFVNGLVGVVTFGIYTPTQTKYYIPMRDMKNNQTSGAQTEPQEQAPIPPKAK